MLKIILEPKEQLKLSVDEDIKENSKVIWKSSDSTVAEVDENGILKAISKGDTIITVETSDGDYVESIKIYVVNNASKYRLTVDLDIGESFRLSVNNGKDLASVNWFTNDTSIAAVTNTGRVTAVAEGLTLIIVKDDNKNVIGQVYIRVRS